MNGLNIVIDYSLKHLFDWVLSVILMFETIYIIYINILILLCQVILKIKNRDIQLSNPPISVHDCQRKTVRFRYTVRKKQ